MVTARKSRLKAVDGILLLNKPAGLTSNQALQRVKRLLKAKKAGHTGSLDPAATGMLPLCFGEATKVCAFLLNADKTYRVTARLGTATDTADADGKVIAEAEVPELEPQDWLRIVEGFRGESTQVPPMYSALKKDGKRLYELARQGEVVERQPRPIRIDSIELLECSGKRLLMQVSCSKGTYIRTLVEDIAQAAGTVAHTSRLHRVTVGPFFGDHMIDLPAAEVMAESGALEDALIAADEALKELPEVVLGAEDGERFRMGQAVQAGAQPANAVLLRVYGPPQGKDFLGVGEVAGDGGIAPKRVFAKR